MLQALLQIKSANSQITPIKIFMGVVFLLQNNIIYKIQYERETICDRLKRIKFK